MPERLQAALAAARERLGEHATTAALERGRASPTPQ
jgi:hypothetical protein